MKMRLAFLLSLIGLIFGGSCSQADKTASLMAEADQGDAEAQFNLGVCYNDGKGVNKDLNQAHIWFKLASAGGYESDNEFLKEIESKMTRFQVAEANILARELGEKNKLAAKIKTK